MNKNTFITLEIGGGQAGPYPSVKSDLELLKFHKKDKKRSRFLTGFTPPAAGFTLLEIIFSIAIVSLIAFLTLISFNELRRNQILVSETENILSLLSDARGRALASQNNSEYGVYFSANQVILFAGSSYSGAAIRQINLPTSLSITGINLAGSSSFVVFQRITGKTTTPGTVRVQLSVNGKAQVVRVESSGLSHLD